MRNKLYELASLLVQIETLFLRIYILIDTHSQENQSNGRSNGRSKRKKAATDLLKNMSIECLAALWFIAHTFEKTIKQPILNIINNPDNKCYLSIVISNYLQDLSSAIQRSEQRINTLTKKQNDETTSFVSKSNRFPSSKTLSPKNLRTRIGLGITNLLNATIKKNPIASGLAVGLAVVLAVKTIRYYQRKRAWEMVHSKWARGFYSQCLYIEPISELDIDYERMSKRYQASNCLAIKLATEAKTERSTSTQYQPLPQQLTIPPTTYQNMVSPNPTDKSYGRTPVGWIEWVLDGTFGPFIGTHHQ